MALSKVEESFLVAAYFRGVTENTGWTSNSDQIVALSLYYTGNITFQDCEDRFSLGCVKNYDKNVELFPEVRDRYRALLDFVERYPEYIDAAGDLVTPADPTYTSCRLTAAGVSLAIELIDRFPDKPGFAHWPDKRKHPSDG